ncbi:MAG: hypothetical protein JWM81_372 [Candidatus Saccharibacteria bacterium]|nr:hypothetical protein [Candidatus Saccharibacteria bacterium]
MDNPEFARFESLLQPPMEADKLQDAVDNISRSLQRMYHHPPGGSPEIKSFAMAAIECVQSPEEYPEFNQVLQSFVSSRQDKRHKGLKLPDYQAQLLRIGFQYVLMDMDPAYPAGGRDTDKWHGWFGAILENPYRRAMLEDALWANDNQANDEKRYAGGKIAIAAYADRLPAELSLIDVGCSAGLGPIQLGENLPFSDFKIKASGYAGRLIRKALRRNLNLKVNAGLDKVPEINWPWVEACSYYPHELTNVRRKYLRGLLFRKHDGFSFVQGDITKGETAEGLQGARKLVPGGKYLVGMAFNSMYEVDPPELGRAMNSFESLASGLAIVQDAVKISRKDPRRLEFAADIYDHPYNLVCKDLTVPNQPYVLLGTWSSFRCGTFTATEYLEDRLEAVQRLL